MSEREHVAEPIPVTVIGGYLGSGKTTLVNHLLRTSAGRRIAVLVNEFGALSIDEDLIESRDETMIKIAGGCVCCSYGSDMMAALMDIQKLSPVPDHVLLEASGVALPGAVAQSVGLLSGCKLDGTVVLADAETVKDRAADSYLSDTITRQLAAADIVLLNKIDLVEGTGLQDTYRWIGTASPEARILMTTQAAVAPDLLLGVTRERVLYDNAYGHGESATGHHALAIELNGPVDAEVLASQLTARELDLVRAKGVVCGADGVTRVIQVVGRRWWVGETPAGFTGSGRLVCIRAGGAVDEAAIRGVIGMATR
ncbi:MAG: hypothetical protein ETSY1_29780 [Candidatus Entotheonella factor]|uniref:CobW/HypB/UreG nucleotide-binding domain-containing protein n=1 Tax=Entotheonella factor TaxID=1429438 RepID=W4LC03_ENTF1|nr:CobW family GTP-binding protein [Candidatus Entotheonella palauensis]ETW95638.1 MAG: hypothetical protein ETSY1_29780 [Candidatus Entotheonella factor]